MLLVKLLLLLKQELDLVNLLDLLNLLKFLVSAVVQLVLALNIHTLGNFVRVGVVRSKLLLLEEFQAKTGVQGVGLVDEFLGQLLLVLEGSVDFLNDSDGLWLERGCEECLKSSQISFVLLGID